MKEILKAVGVKYWITKGKKMGWGRKAQKKPSASSTSDGEKRSRRHTPRCTIAKQPKTKPSIVRVGIFPRARSLDQKESSKAICSLQRALSAKTRRVHTLEHLFQEAT